MCSYFCDAAQTGSVPSWGKYGEYQQESSRRAKNMAVRSRLREWLVEMNGPKGQELRFLPNYLFSREDAEDRFAHAHAHEAHDLRKRLQGEVYRVPTSTEGWIKLGAMGFELFFKPRVRERSAFYPSDAAKRTRVSFAVAFTYDKPVAFDVQRVEPD